MYHIARSEVWQKALGELKETPHFDLYIKNTVVTKSPTRAWTI